MKRWRRPPAFLGGAFAAAAVRIFTATASAAALTPSEATAHPLPAGHHIAKEELVLLGSKDFSFLEHEAQGARKILE